MRIAIERRQRPVPRPELVEIVTPRTNGATITPAENLFAAISLAEPFSLEIAATGRARWFVVRAGTPAMRGHLEDQFGAAYPQAEIRRLDVDRHPGLDPARLGPEEQVAACTLALRRPEYLPLRTFQDAEVDASRAAQADPMLGILAGLGDLPDGWRGLAQLVLSPAPDNWCQSYLRLAVEHPLAAERTAASADTSRPACSSWRDWSASAQSPCKPISGISPVPGSPWGASGAAPSWVWRPCSGWCGV
ncbi:MAG: hypothetical protein NTZ05_07110 [Chloroflexi bacterium]|nr:hypothetical protein [Chloroflexota bacterium]